MGGILTDAQKKAREEALSAGKKRKEVLEALKLTDDQKEKVQAVGKEVAGLVREELEKIRDVLAAEQAEKLQAMKEERADRREECLAHAIAQLKDLDLTDAEMTKIGEIRKEYRPKIETALKEMNGFLTEAQKKTREDALKAGKSRRELVESLNLTDEQKVKAVTVAKQVSALVREESEKIEEFLTSGQKEQLQVLQEERSERVRDRKAHRIANSKELNLTDDQKARITSIRQEYRPKIHEAGNKLRAVVREEVEQIVAVFKG